MNLLSKINILYKKVNTLSPRKKKLLLIILWIIAPVEMILITGSLFGYKVIRSKLI